MFDKESLTTTFVLNGKATKAEVPAAHVRTSNEYHANNITLGSDRFKGEISDVNMWATVFSDEEAVEWTSCKSNTTGSIYSWNSVELLNSAMLEIDLDKTEMCQFKVIGLLNWDPPSNYKDADISCRKKGGYVGFTTEANIRASHHFTNITADTIWTGYTDLRQENHFVNHIGNRLDLNSSHWYQGEPNGNTFENCAAARLSTKVTYDITCNVALNFYCWLEDLKKFTLRGIPEKYDIDDMFYIDLKSYSLKGSHKSEIFNTTKKRNFYKLTSYNKTILTIKSDEFPLGKLNWRDPQTNDSVLLSLDICNDTQYNCDNGICIDIRKRCDKISDCPDGSDEDYCQTVDFPAGYQQSDIPVIRTEDKDEPLILDIVYFSLKLVDLKETESRFYIQFGMYTKWRDNRLKYYNLEMNTNNSVSTMEAKKMWLPDYTLFMITEDGLVEDIGSRNVVLFPQKNGTATGPEHVNKSLVFDGKDVDIIIRNWYSASIVCDLTDLQNYPFDTNECKFQIALAGTPSAWNYNMPNVAMKESFQMKFSPKEFGAYHINNVFTKTTSTCRLKVIIELRRRFFSVFIKDSLPSILLSIIVYLSNLYYMEQFETAITVNVTCLLAISGFFIAVFANIPETSFVKIMDFLQIKSILTVTLVILTQTFFVFKYTKKVRSMRGERIRKLLGMVIPAIGLGIDVVYVVLGFSHDSNLS